MDEMCVFDLLELWNLLRGCLYMTEQPEKGVGSCEEKW